MCMGGGSTKVSVPEPAPLPPPKPAPVAPPIPAPPKPLQQAAQAPDIRIGAAKKQSTANRNRGNLTPGKSALSIGNNQGMTL